jgi:protein TonB
VFSRLPESNAKRQRRTGGLVVSTAVHLGIIALAVRATALTATPRPKSEVVPPIYLARTLEPKTATPTAPAPRRFSADPTMAPLPAPVAPPALSIEIPDGIPAAGSMNGLLEPAFTPTRAASGPATGSPNVSDGSPMRENQVEQAVIAIPGTATPRYPSMLQSAGLEGDVRAQFVVDTLGRVEQGSFRAVETTHALFAAAVRDALGRARFTPAQVGGHKVRQLVEQTFTFRIER